MMRLINFKRVLIVLLIFLLALAFVGCDGDKNNPSATLSAGKDNIEMYVGDELDLDTLYTTNIDKDDLSFDITNSSVIDIIDGELVAKSLGKVFLIISYVSDTSLNIEIEINVKESPIYAESIESVESLALYINESVDVSTLYSVLPVGFAVEYDIADKSIISIDENLIFAKAKGSTILTISAISSDTAKISTAILIEVKDKNILDVALLDKEGNVPNIIVDKMEYIVKIKTFEDFKIDNIKFSDNIEVICSEIIDNYAIVTVKLLNLGDYNISYDMRGFDSTTIDNNFVHRSLDDYSVTVNGNNLLMEGNKYKFLLGEEGATNPFCKSAKIVVRYKDKIITDYEIEIFSGEDSISLSNGVVAPVAEGEASVKVVVDGVTKIINFVVEKSYINDFTLEFADKIYVSETTAIEFDIIKDKEYNFFPADPVVELETENAIVDGLSIDVSKVVEKFVKGYVVIGEIRKEFEIELASYDIDSVVIKYNDELCTELVIDRLGYLVLEFSFMKDSERITIQGDLPLYVSAEDAEVIKSFDIEVYRWIYVYIQDVGKTHLIVTDKFGNEICKLLISVENSI